MNILKYPKTWLVIMLLASLLISMLIIVKHYNAKAALQNRLDNHSEITGIDTT